MAAAIPETMTEIDDSTAEPIDEAVDAPSDEETAEPNTGAAVAEELPRLDSILESLLFAASTPLSLRRLLQLLEGPTAKEVVAAMRRLQQRYNEGRRGLRLVEVAGGYQFRTAPENVDYVRSLLREKPARLGRATLETLSIIAYKQPATRAEIEAIRGVDVEGALSSLLSKRLIKISGRKEAVGRPLLYVTTPEFLEVFGLKDLNELPTLKELPTGETTEEASESTAPDADGEAESGVEPGAPAEAAEPGGSELATSGGGADSGGEGPRQREAGDGAGDEGGSPEGPDHR
jgi:segregation and condensation protein B